MPRLAVIDIGTNSVKMTLAETSAKNFVLIDERAKTTRLGEGVDASRRLAEDAMARTFAAISEFVLDARGLGAARIAATGTSALRDASNGSVLLDQVRRELGIAIEIITGPREAELAYRAVASDASMNVGSAALLVFDIGGGSTELICGSGSRVTRFRSLDIGAVRLTERHLHSDPPTREEYAAARADASSQLMTFAACLGSMAAISGVGGTAVNVAAVVYGEKDVHGKSITREQLKDTVDRFLSVPLQTRKTIPGLEPERADIILGGTAILEELLDRYQADALQVSVRGMRYGLIAEMAEE